MSDASRKPVGLVVAGAGMIGQAHIQRILALPGADLTGLVDPSAKVMEQAGTLGVPCFCDLEKMLDELQPDGVVIASPNQLHFAAGMACIAKGVPILIEKPLCETVEQAKALADASENTGVAVLVGHHRRHSPSIRRARDIIQSGQLGEITAVHGFACLLKPESYFEGPGAWRTKPGGGVILINLIHVIDDLRNLCGDVESVQAVTSNAARGFAVEDTAGAILKFRNGAIGTLALSDAAASPWSWEMTSGENKAFPRSDESCYFIAGRKASLSVPRLELWRHEAGGGWWSPLMAQRSSFPEQDLLTQQSLSDPLTNEMQHFCDIIRGEATPLLDARGGAKTLETTLAVREAALTGKIVYLAA